MSQTGKNWEGIGGPISLDRPNFDDIDPTLDACCRREEESNRRGDVLKRTLQKYDVVAEKERRRRHLVQTSAFAGCRCCYDPNSDGGEYRALIELREERKKQEAPEDEEDALEEKENAKLKSKDDEDEEDDSDDDEFDYLLDEDLPGQNEELKALEEMRRQELEFDIFKTKIEAQHGYGVHRQMHPSRLLRSAGLATGKAQDPPPAVVLHLVDADSIASASLDLYLEKLAKRSKGTKFLRSGGRSTLLMDAELAGKVLPPLRPDTDMPALIAVRDGVVVNTCPKLQGLTDPSSCEIVESAVFDWLDRTGVLLERAPLLEAICRIRPEEEALMDYLMSTKPAQEEERFDCGMAECNKSFPHEHVGVQTSQQEGLVVSEQEVVGSVEKVE